jgi:hypothetical protein
MEYLGRAHSYLLSSYFGPFLSPSFLRLDSTMASSFYLYAPYYGAMYSRYVFAYTVRVLASKGGGDGPNSYDSKKAWHSRKKTCQSWFNIIYAKFM